MKVIILNGRGPMGPVNQGPQGERGLPGGIMDFQGDYNASTLYYANQGVMSSEGRMCYARQNTLGNAPPLYPLTQNEYWYVCAERGRDGAAGADGSTDATTLSGASLSVDKIATPGVDTKLPTEQAIRETLQDLLAVMSDGIYRQAIINGDFEINQQAVSTYNNTSSPPNSDGNYIMDQWVLLSDGNNVANISQETTMIPTGAGYALKAEVATANKKFGFFQPIESRSAKKFSGKAVSLQFTARSYTGKAIRNLRAAVVTWNGTADSITRDIVSSWRSEDSDPTLVSGWTMENIPANLALSESGYIEFLIENINVDTSGLQNLGIFIWINDSDCVIGDLLYLSKVQLNAGNVCLPYMATSFATELYKCMRFYEKSYAYTVAPGTASTTGAIYFYTGTATTGYLMTTLYYRVPKRIAVVPTLYDGAGASGYITYDISGNGKTGNAAQHTESHCRIYSDGTTSKNGIMFHFVADVRL